MATRFRTPTLSVFATLILSASAANATPLEECRNLGARPAIPQCTLVIDDGRESPGNRAYAHLLRARAEMDLSELESAQADIAAALVVQPGNPFAYRLRARLRDLQNRPAEARADYTTALHLSDAPAQKYLAYLERGQFLARIKQYPEALTDFDAAILVDGSKAAPYVGRAIVYRETGKVDAALANFDRAASIEPAFWLTYVERGDTLMALMRFNEAVAAYDMALARRPNDARAQRGRTAAIAVGATAQSKPDAPTKVAKPDLPGGQPPAGQAAGASNPTGGDAEAREKRLQDARALRKDRKFAEALATYEDMLKAAPTDVEAAIEKGRTLMQLTRWKDAMDTFKAVIDAKGTPDAAKAVALSNQGEIFAEVGDYIPAIKATSEALRLNPRHIGALYWRGFSQVQLGAFASAIADFQQGETLAPKESLFPSALAHALIGAGNAAAAKEAIARSARNRAGQCGCAARPRAAAARGRRYRCRRGGFHAGHEPQPGDALRGADAAADHAAQDHEVHGCAAETAIARKHEALRCRPPHV